MGDPETGQTLTSHVALLSEAYQEHGHTCVMRSRRRPIWVGIYRGAGEETYLGPDRKQPRTIGVVRTYNNRDGKGTHAARCDMILHVKEESAQEGWPLEEKSDGHRRPMHCTPAHDDQELNSSPRPIKHALVVCYGRWAQYSIPVVTLV